MRARKKEIGSKLVYLAITILCCAAMLVLSLKAFYFNDKNDTPVNLFDPNEEQTEQTTNQTNSTNATMQEYPQETIEVKEDTTIDNSSSMTTDINDGKLEQISATQDDANTSIDEEKNNPPIDDEEWAKEYVAKASYDINDHQPTFGETVYARENTTGYTYGQRMYPAVNITIPKEGSSMKNYTDEVDTSTFQYYGDFRITGYSPYCAHCCGGSTSGLTASGNNAVCGYTVSCTKDIPFGTTLYIEGYGFYVVEDRGVPYKDLIDIACPSHEDCYPITGYDIPVYIVSYGSDNNNA